MLFIFGHRWDIHHPTPSRATGSRNSDLSNGNQAPTNHVLYVYISAYFPPEGGGCYQALDAVTYQASVRGYDHE
jgi:hypothetical protein